MLQELVEQAGRRVEKLRAEASNNDLKMHLGELFWDWGIPTAASLIEVKKTVELPIIASGGLRNGLEIAKCIALGASMCAMAYPFLLRAAESSEHLFNFADTIIAELKRLPCFSLVRLIFLF